MYKAIFCIIKLHVHEKSIAFPYIQKIFFILAVIGAGMYIAISHFRISLWYGLLFDNITGVIFGKVFCHWMCPIWIIMEILMSLNKGVKMKQMYLFHKLACPIAWISVWLNWFPTFKIKLNTNTCQNFCICDEKCYIVAIEPAKDSLYKPAKDKPGSSYTCSKFLQCLAACPNGSLTYKV